MRRVSWSRRAQRDLDLIESFWLPMRPDYVEALFGAIPETTAFLRGTPGAGTPQGSADLRRWRIGRTPYLIFYRFSRSEVRIVRIRHEHENWKPTP